MLKLGNPVRNLVTTVPKVRDEFMAGKFSVKRTDSKFCQIPTDQTLEHINRVAKVSGGIVGITHLEAVRDRWCLTVNVHGLLMTCLHCTISSQQTAMMISATETLVQQVFNEMKLMSDVMSGSLSILGYFPIVQKTRFVCPLVTLPLMM